MPDTIRDLLAARMRDELKRRTLLPTHATGHPLYGGRPVAIGLTEYDLADVALNFLEGVRTPATAETARVLDDVRRERVRQAEKGFTPDHDDSFHRQPGHRFIALGKTRATSPGPGDDGYLSRRRMIEGIAMLVAAVEILDRTEARGESSPGVKWSES